MDDAGREPEADDKNVFRLPFSQPEKRRRGRPRKDAATQAASEPPPDVLSPWLKRLWNKYGELLARMSDREQITGYLLIIPASGTGILTYFGVSEPMAEQGATMIQKAQGILFSASVATFAWLYWHYLFRMLPQLRRRNLRMAALAGAASISVLAAVDAPFNMLALSSGAAVQLSLAETSAAYEAAKDAAARQSTVMQNLIPALNVQAQRFQAQSADEVKNGTYSGDPDPGKVSAGFALIGEQLSNLAEELIESGLAAGALQEQVASELHTMKAAVYRAGPVRERSEAVSASADRLDTLFTQMARHGSSVSVRATLDTLDDLFPAAASAKTDFEKRQLAELQLIAQSVRPVADTLKEAVAELDAVAVSEAKRPRPIPAFTAIWRYWRELLPHWIAALFVTVAPGGLLVILFAANREADDCAGGSGR